MSKTLERISAKRSDFTVADISELEGLLEEALRVQKFGCDHKGIGLPGCRTCDPRTYPYRR